MSTREEEIFRPHVFLSASASVARRPPRGARRDAAHTLFVYCLLVYNYTSTTYVERRINTTTHATYVTHNSLISLCYFRDGYVNRTPKLSDAHASTLFLPAFTPMILKFVFLSNECGLRTQTFDNHFCI